MIFQTKADQQGQLSVNRQNISFSLPYVKLNSNYTDTEIKLYLIDSCYLNKSIGSK